MKKLIAILLTLALVFSFAACSGGEKKTPTDVAKTTYKIGICNFVDDASLNQIVASIRSKLAEIGSKNNVSFEISYDNCNTDPNVMNQIIADFIAQDVDLMVGVATPVAMAMQSATEENGIPVVFAAVSDPLSCELVDSLENPGKNVTGTSDFLNTDAIMDIIFAVDEDVKTVGLLYDVGQDSSTTPIASAKKYLDEKNIRYVERTGRTNDEVLLAAQALVADGVDVVFTPTDNTIMKAELSIYEIFAEAGIPHYTGADSFALNGAFLGYGVDYENLGYETADMISEILLNGANPAETPVRMFDNGTATVNTETCEALGLDYDEIVKAITPHCTAIQSLVTAEEF